MRRAWRMYRCSSPKKGESSAGRRGTSSLTTGDSVLVIAVVPGLGYGYGGVINEQ